MIKTISNKLSNLKFLFAATMLFTFVTSYAQDEASAASLYNDGLAMLKEKKYEEGLPLLEQALEKATIEENEQVIELSKKNGAIAAYNIGKSKYKEEKYDEAIAIYKKGIEINPEYSSNYSGLAGVYRKLEKFNESVDNYILAAKIADKNGKSSKSDKTISRLSVIVGKQYTSGNFDEAIALGNRINAFQPVAAIHYYMARSYLEKNDPKSALEQANAAIEVGKQDEEMEDKFYIAQAMAHVALGNKAEAIQAYEMVKDETYLEQAQYQITKLKE